mmetsp:Transcript_19166/g.66617  ORF Transcript_19166/g.66617 Transcript_19166/m.66617 type:complete len:251 (-) Transcript_19166:762-1514(-)
MGPQRWRSLHRELLRLLRSRRAPWSTRRFERSRAQPAGPPPAHHPLQRMPAYGRRRGVRRRRRRRRRRAPRASRRVCRPPTELLQSLAEHTRVSVREKPPVSGTDLEVPAAAAVVPAPPEVRVHLVATTAAAEETPAAAKRLVPLAAAAPAENRWRAAAAKQAPSRQALSQLERRLLLSRLLALVFLGRPPRLTTPAALPLPPSGGKLRVLSLRCRHQCGRLPRLPKPTALPAPPSGRKLQALSLRCWNR